MWQPERPIAKYPDQGGLLAQHEDECALKFQNSSQTLGNPPIFKGVLQWSSLSVHVAMHFCRPGIRVPVLLWGSAALEINMVRQH